MVSNLFEICKKMAWLQFGRVFPLSIFLSLSSSISSSFIAAVPHFHLPFIPPFSDSGSPSWDFNCYIVGKRGMARLPQRFWEKRNYRDSVGSCSRFLGGLVSARYMTLVGILPWPVLVSGWLMFIPVFCSYHLAEVIHAGAEIVAWPTWCFYLLNTSPPVSGLASEMSLE